MKEEKKGQIIQALNIRITSLRLRKDDEMKTISLKLKWGLPEAKIGEYNYLCARLEYLERYLEILENDGEVKQFNVLHKLSFLGDGFNIESSDIGRMLAVRDIAQIIADIQ